MSTIKKSTETFNMTCATTIIESDKRIVFHLPSEIALNLREVVSVIPQDRIRLRRQLYTASSHVRLSPYKEAPRDSTQYRASSINDNGGDADKAAFFLPLVGRRKTFRILRQGHRQPIRLSRLLFCRPDFAPVTPQRSPPPQGTLFLNTKGMY